MGKRRTKVRSRKRTPRAVRPNQRFEAYDSKFEHDLHKSVLKGWDNHGHEVAYQIQKKYLPDFIKVIGGITYYIEAKGRFWDSDEYSKYRWVRDSLNPKTERLVFIFQTPSAPMPRAKKRKDGTKRTHAEWADLHGFQWFSKDTFKEELLC